MKNAEISFLSYKMKEAEATGFKPGAFAFFCFPFLSKMNFKNVFLLYRRNEYNVL